MEKLLELAAKFPAASEYLSTIYLIRRDYEKVTNAKLAERMEVSRPAVSQAVKRLKSLDLVDQDLYGLIKLTEKGENYASSVLRRHYLIEHLLVDMLAYPWEKSDVEAKNLQDKISTEFTNHLYEKLGRPDRCPHGNPMPGSEAEKTIVKSTRLHHAELGQVVRVQRITEEGEEIPGLLHACHEFGIRPNEIFLVKEKNEENLNLVRVSDDARGVINNLFASYIDIETIGI
ncbi:metal-dependent transcriptional regulator [Spirochaeta cellobiosiphila]|uniref:metal-dependent transcriptional regulator n=1 Tax=Spirochaeta cellobiosiphila TaxID=504483 RepID=UPI0003FA3EEA|nr:metal-dependent transcriptional regulator [Spirochaeta cellobiosiphila]